VHRIRPGISWLTERLSASPEEFLLHECINYVFRSHNNQQLNRLLVRTEKILHKAIYFISLKPEFCWRIFILFLPINNWTTVLNPHSAFLSGCAYATCCCVHLLHMFIYWEIIQNWIHRKRNLEAKNAYRNANVSWIQRNEQEFEINLNELYSKPSIK
jgi:hypothetical protein